MRITFKGIHPKEILDCGCTVRRYTEGKVIFDSTRNCTETPRHRTRITHICGICGLITSKKLLKTHKHEEHAI